MTSLPNLEQYTELAASEPEVAQAPAITEEFEYEIVLGHGQFAAISLVAVVLLAVCSGVSYAIGKKIEAAAVAAATPAVRAPAAPARVQQTPAPIPAVPAGRSPKEQAPKLQEPKEQIRTTIPPLFGAVVAGQVYLQMGIIEKGTAGTWVEGLRTHGLDAFAAPGPADGLGMWRVLVGPLPDPKTFQRAKDTMDALGVPNFGRTF